MPELRGEITREMDEFINQQISKGYYPSRAELQRDAVRKIMREHGLDPYVETDGGEL